MSAIPIVTKQGQRTYVPAEPIIGGQVVEGRAGGRIGVAAAGSAKVIGVAVTDAATPESFTGQPTVVNGRQVLNAAVLPVNVTVVSAGIEVPVTYAANAAFGDKLIAAAGGAVTPAGAAPDARTIVGKCIEPGGVVVATKPTGLMQTI